MWWSNFREKVNLSIYNSKRFVLLFFRWTQALVALSMISVLVYYYGFPQTSESKVFLNRIIEFSFIFYIVRFFVKVIYDFNPINFLKERWFEALVVVFLIFEGVSFNMFGVLVTSDFFKTIGFNDFTDFSNIAIQIIFMIYIFMEIFRKRDFKQYFKVHPGLLFMLSILIIILIGTGLLMLPEMSIEGYDMSFLDALFVSTSATSCAGMDAIGMGSVLSFKGQVVVLFLIQIGALNTIAFVALYLLIAKFGIGLKQHDIIEDYVNSESFLDSESMFFRIIKWVIGIEFIGFILIFLVLKPIGEFHDLSSRLYFAIFNSVSSFCNSGIMMETGGFQHQLLRDNYILQLIIITLFFLGGFGMVYLFDLFGIRSLRKRMRFPWKTLRFDTKVTLFTTLLLIVLGAIVYAIFEYDNTLEGKSPFGKLVTTFYNSMIPRYTGISSVDFSTLGYPFLVFTLFLMFIGASSGSSGGGIRVSTFAILFSSVIATIRGKTQVELFKRSIDNSLVLKAYSILMFFIVGNIIGIFALTITEEAAITAGQISIFDLIFEHVSASCTVGLTLNVTPILTDPGKIIIILAMFIGRVGTLSIAYLFSRKLISKRYKYPKGHIIVG
ncbi:MAG: hypothetical protein H3C31_04480 [Brumimicrobium sp.]|nr:hypothetical protein [Brumimicrobium sp.]MCO5268824.1 hypothetical protein [Brumimicrobium sp.]